jgi:hypothetical protein
MVVIEEIEGGPRSRRALAMRLCISGDEEAKIIHNPEHAVVMVSGMIES